MVVGTHAGRVLPLTTFITTAWRTEMDEIIAKLSEARKELRTLRDTDTIPLVEGGAALARAIDTISEAIDLLIPI
jgi:hypothetical protein